MDNDDLNIYKIQNFNNFYDNISNNYCAKNEYDTDKKDVDYHFKGLVSTFKNIFDDIAESDIDQLNNINSEGNSRLDDSMSNEFENNNIKSYSCFDIVTQNEDNIKQTFLLKMKKFLIKNN